MHDDKVNFLNFSSEKAQVEVNTQPRMQQSELISRLRSLVTFSTITPPVVNPKNTKIILDPFSLSYER